jgi:hypothetical protein
MTMRSKLLWAFGVLAALWLLGSIGSRSARIPQDGRIPREKGWIPQEKGWIPQDGDYAEVVPLGLYDYDDSLWIPMADSVASWQLMEDAMARYVRANPNHADIYQLFNQRRVTPAKAGARCIVLSGGKYLSAIRIVEGLDIGNEGILRTAHLRPSTSRRKALDDLSPAPGRPAKRARP